MPIIRSYISDDLKVKIQAYCKSKNISESTFIKLAADEIFKKERKENK